MARAQVQPQPVSSAPVAELADEFGSALYARFFSGLADETRLRIVRLLLDGPRSVGELVAALGIAQSRVSNHLSCLKWCGYVRTQRSGKYVIYELGDPRIAEIVALAQGVVARNAAHIEACTRLG
ncbi:MAG: ArsR/SmtB family transcription factor [Candidatus Baltobacteraceae bacterium]